MSWCYHRHGLIFRAVAFAPQRSSKAAQSAAGRQKLACLRVQFYPLDVKNSKIAVLYLCGKMLFNN